MFTVDTMNNVRRLCSVRGCAGYRMWRVCVAVSGGRYLLRNVASGEYRVANIMDMTYLY